MLSEIALASPFDHQGGQAVGEGEARQASITRTERQDIRRDR